MPFLPEIPTWDNATINTQTFLGLNRGLSIGDGEMADMLNMSSDSFPVLGTRRPRGLPTMETKDAPTEFDGEISGMLGTDRLIICHGEKVYVDGREIPLKLSADPAMGNKKLVSMGAYVCIWPDKKFFNINNFDDYGDMGSKWAAAEGDTISAMMCRRDGTDYDMEKIPISPTAPEEPTDKDFWLDTSGEIDVLKQYSYMHQQWIQVATTYIKIEAPGIGKDLKEFDSVWLSGAAIQSDGSPVSTAFHSGKDVELASSYSVTYVSSEYGRYNETTTPTVSESTQTVKVTGVPDGAVIKGAQLKFDFSGVLKETQYTAAPLILTVNGITFSADAGEKIIPLDVKTNGDVNLKFVYQTGVALEGFSYVDYSRTFSVKIENLSVSITYESTEEATKDDKEIQRLNNVNIVYGRGENYIIVAGLLHQALVLSNALTAEMKIPDLDYICEANNRIWGCSYSEKDGTILNEIHACSLGDFRNWYKFQGTSMDSYTVTVGSDGVFTGAFSMQGTPLFFKESYMHKVAGNLPSNFTLNTLRCRGVQEGCWKSLVLVNETLFYKSRTDVMAYEGALPDSVSEKLGTDLYRDAAGGMYRDKYYLSMQDEQKKWHVYVFDTTKGLWHQEDMVRVTHMANAGGELVMAIKQGDKTALKAVHNTSGDQEEFEWSVTFGTFGYQYETQKYLSRFNIRAQLSTGGYMKLEIMYDSDGKWHHMGTMRSPRMRTYLLPIIPRRCDHCQVRISGKGETHVYSIARIFEQGGDG